MVLSYLEYICITKNICSIMCSKNEINDICEKIDKLVLSSDLEKVIKYCQNKKNLIYQKEQNEKIILALKYKHNKIPQLVKFADGLKIISYNRDLSGYDVTFEYLISICNINKNCKYEECKHLQIWGSGSYNKEDLSADIEYRITSNDSTQIETTYLGSFEDTDYDIDEEEVNKIADEFDFDANTKIYLISFIEDIVHMV
jgi:hypothetical protein